MIPHINNRPKCLAEKQIREWEQRFDTFASKTVTGAYHTFTSGITLTFSDEEILLPYKSLENAKEEIKKRFRIPDDLMEEFECAGKDQLLQLVSPIASFNSEKYNEIGQEIIDILINTADIHGKFHSYVAGQYFRDMKKIVLYNKVIASEDIPGKTLEQSYEEVFAHEMFHALHYYLAEKESKEFLKEILCREDETATVVKESLAAFFEFHYCKELGIPTDIAEIWAKNSPADYPYAGAKYIKDLDAFNTVLNESYTDFDKALRTLLASKPDEFYDVKNIVKVRIHYVDLPVIFPREMVSAVDGGASSKSSPDDDPLDYPWPETESVVGGRTPSKFSFDDVLREFRSWLEKGPFTAGTSKCYANSYLRGIKEKVLDPWFESKKIDTPYAWFNQNPSNKPTRESIEILSEYIIENEMSVLSCDLTEKTVSNYRSGLRAFFDFMDSEDFYFDCSLKKKDLKCAISDFEKVYPYLSYSKDQAEKTFFSRLITQDRAYEKMIYPARVLNQMFNKSARKDDYKNLLKNAIEGTEFLISDDPKDSPIKFSKITTIKIDPKKEQVKVLYKRKEYDLFTKNPLKGSIEKFPAKCFGDLSLDHDTPLDSILNTSKAQVDYPKLKELSDLYASFVLREECTDDYLSASKTCGRNLRTFAKESGAFCKDTKIKTQIFDSEFIEAIYSDLEKLFGEIKLVLMYGPYNSSKGKGLLASSLSSDLS